MAVSSFLGPECHWSHSTILLPWYSHCSRLIRVRHFGLPPTDTPKDVDHPVWAGALLPHREILKFPLDLARLWLHEAERVYGDKMVDEKDQDTLRRVTIVSTKQFLM